MSKSPRLILASGLLMLAIVACNLPSSQSSSQPDLAATITAQALLLQAPTSTSESQTQTPAAIGPQVSVSATVTPLAMSQAQTNTPKPTKTPKPTATFTPSVISMPANLSGSRTCANGLSGSTPIWKETYTLTWTDNNTTETGYQIYRNALLVASLAANSTHYSNTFQYDLRVVGPSHDLFGVEAWNDDESAIRDVAISRCP